MNAPALIPQVFTYCIRNDANGMAKIGRSINPTARLRQLQTGSPHPLRLVCAIAGNERTEAVVHDLFSWARLSGEWFDDAGGDISAEMLRIAKIGIVPYLRARAQLDAEHADALEAEGQVAGAA